MLASLSNSNKGYLLDHIGWIYNHDAKLEAKETLNSLPEKLEFYFLKRRKKLFEKHN